MYIAFETPTQKLMLATESKNSCTFEKIQKCELHIFILTYIQALI